MELISLASIIDFFPPCAVFSRRNDKQYWSGWISQDGETRSVTVEEVHLDESGLKLTVKDGTDTYKLKAVPRDASHTAVYLNDTLVEGAAMVFALKGNPLNPTRFGFDFRPVPLHGNQARFNMRYDP